MPGAAAAVVISRGEQWPAIVLLAPVYLTYKTYQVFVGRLQDRDRHASEARQLHFETTNALVAGAGRRESAGTRKGSSCRHRRGVAPPRERAQGTARARAGGACQCGGRQPSQGSVPGDGVARTADAAERHPWLGGHAAPARHRRGTRDRASEIDLRQRAAAGADNRRAPRRRPDRFGQPSARTGGSRSRAHRPCRPRSSKLPRKPALEIVVDADESNEIVYGDASRLQQIVWNLLSNAVKFSEEAGRVVVRLRRVNAIAELTVTDDGIGIPAEFLPWVFEPFRQADASNTRRHGGLGLGLSIVKHLTEAHGGTINASSEGPTHGATFVVRLPTRPSADRGPSSERSAARPDSPESLNGLSVLVLDDDRESLAVASAHLKSRLATVWLAESSPQAIEILQREHIDVILADIAMPGEDGYTFIKRVRALNVKAVDDARGSPHRARERRRPAASAPFRVSAAPSEADRSGFTHRRRRTTRTAQPAIDVRKSSFLRQFRANLRVRTGTNQPEQRPRRLSSGLQRGRFMAFACGLLRSIPVIVLGATIVAQGQVPAGAQAPPPKPAAAAPPSAEAVKRAEQILAASREALGGEKLAALKTLSASGTHEARSGQQPGADRVRDPHRAAEQICTRR